MTLQFSDVSRFTRFNGREIRRGTLYPRGLAPNVEAKDPTGAARKQP